MRFSGAWKGILAAIVGILLLFLVLAVEIYRFSAKEESRRADVAIVLGAAVWDGQPSPVFLERINHAVALQRNDVVDKIIFTGGESEAATMVATCSASVSLSVLSLILVPASVSVTSLMPSPSVSISTEINTVSGVGSASA